MPKQSQLSAEVRAARMELTKMRRNRAQCRVVAKDKPTELLLYGVIGGFWGDIQAKNVAQFLSDNDGKDVTIRVHSPGGDVFESVAIQSAIRGHNAKVTTIVDGLAASAAVAIVLAGEETEMSDASQLMIHNPWSFAMGESKDMRKLADQLDKVAGQIADGYSKRTGKDKAELLQMMADETWMTADEAKTNGFIDRVIDSTKKKKATQNAWNQRTYNQFVAALRNQTQRFKPQDSSTVDEPDSEEPGEFIMNQDLHAKCVAAGMDSKLSGDEAQTWMVANFDKLQKPAESPKPEERPEPNPAPKNEGPKPEDEQNRKSEIRALCRNAKIDETQIDQFCDNGASIADVNAYVVKHLLAQSPVVQDDEAAGGKPEDPDAKYKLAFAKYKSEGGTQSEEAFIRSMKIDAGEQVLAFAAN